MREPKTNLQEIMATHDGASFFDFDQRDTSTPQRQQMSQPNFNDTVASRTSRFDASQAEFTLEAQEIEEGQSRPKPEWKTRLNQTTFTQRDVTETIAIRAQLGLIVRGLLRDAKKEIFLPRRPHRVKDFDPRNAIITITKLVKGSADLLDEESYSVLHVYCAGVTRIAQYFTPMESRNDKKLEKIISIAICFGPDRAFSALKHRDNLFDKFDFTESDYHHGDFHPSMNYDLSTRQAAEVDMMLNKLRIMYRNFLSPSIEDCPVLSSTNQGGERQGISQSLTPYVIRQPQQPTVPQPGSAKRSSQFTTPQSILKKDTPNPFLNDVVVETEIINIKSEPTTPTRSPGTQPHLSRDDSQPQKGERSNCEKEWGRSMGNIRLSRSMPGHYVTNYGYVSAEEYEKLLGSTPSPQSDRSRNSPMREKDSVFRTRGKHLFPGDDHLPMRTRVQTSPGNDSNISETMRTLQKLGLDQDSYAANQILGTAAGCAAVMSEMMKDRKNKQKDIIIEHKTPDGREDTRVATFDFNIYGQSPSEILGERFRNMIFINEGARRETARAIYQRVVDDPQCDERTKEIALYELGNVDAAKTYMQNTNIAAMRALKTLTRPQEDGELSDLIPPPVLGDRSITPNMIKAYLAGLNDEKFEMNNTSKPIRYFLMPLADIITRERLAPNDAYTLLKSGLHKDLWGRVRKAQYDEKMPFNYFWMELQKTSRRNGGADTYRRRIEELLKRVPKDLSATMDEIHSNWMRIHENETNVDLRKHAIERDTLRDLRKLIVTHYQPFYGSINMTFKNKQATERMKETTYTQYGAETFIKDPIGLFIEAANAELCEVECFLPRAREHRGGGRPQIAAATPAKEDEDDSDEENEQKSSKTPSKNFRKNFNKKKQDKPGTVAHPTNSENPKRFKKKKNFQP